MQRIAIFLFLAAFCAGAEAAAPGSKLLVQPESIQLNHLSLEHGLLVTLIEPDGHTVDVTRQSRFVSVSPVIATVSADANCQAVSDGKTELTIEYDGLRAQAEVSVSDTAKMDPPSFRQDIIPILTKAGCNAGSCHGKVAGQNGFRLSLRGYAPEWDYDSLTGELASRRIDFSEPEKSLLLRKPLGLVPHEGGRRFAENSRAGKTLLEWIKARAPGPSLTETDSSKLEVLPGNRTLRVGDAQQLLVRALGSDGLVRDVTWLCQFFSNDPSILTVSENGLVKASRCGETSVRVHFQGLVEVVTFTMPFGSTVNPSVFSEKNNEIDDLVFARLQSLHVPPSGLCDDATFIRRAFLDAIGTLPTPSEIRTFLANPSADKRSRLIDEILQRPEYADYWALQLCDLLQNRRERDHDVRGAKGTRAMHEWLREQTAKNRPWDVLTRELLTSTGDAVHDPQIGYFIVLMGEKNNVEESDVTDSVAQAFLGTRIGCARCHNHPLEKFTQDDYYHFAAFFSHTTLKRTEMGKGASSLIVGTRDEVEIQKQLDEAEKKIDEEQRQAVELIGDEQKKSEGKLAALVHREQELAADKARAGNRPPTVNQPRTNKPMIAQPLDRSTARILPGADARETLSKWITDPKNDAFSGAMVNRLWKHFLGVGLVEPVDDLRSSNPPSNPALMKALREQFVYHGYDLKHIMRLILNSRTYQLSSATMPENQQEHRYFSHYYARRLPAEVMADAISSATGIPDEFPGYPIGLRAIQLPEPTVSSYFLTLFGRSDRVTACACERNGEVTLPQLLHLSNGDDVQNKVRSSDGRLAKILANTKDDHQATEEIFLAIYGRKPNESEYDAVNKALAIGDPREDVYRDLMWAMMNSKEFAFNH